MGETVLPPSLFISIDKGAKQLNCGESLRDCNTTYIQEIECNTRGNDLGHSKNLQDWVIRSELLRALYDLPISPYFPIHMGKYWVESVQRLNGCWSERCHPR